MSGSTLDHWWDRYAARVQGMTTSEIRALFSVASRPEVVSLAGGMPYTAALPMDNIRGLIDELMKANGPTALQYGSGQGELPLREAICDVMAVEGIESSAEEIVVTVGSQQALNLMAMVFLDPGDVVIAEAPTYVGALSSFSTSMCDVVQVAMDDDGLVPSALRETVDRLREAGRRVKFLYTVPNFHNPAGVTLAEYRRDEILEIARSNDILVLEDNPYGLLGLDHEPDRALCARDPDNVVYLGSFSKTFASGLRVGWARAPHPIKDKLVLVSEAQVLCPPQLNQQIVARYLATQPWQDQITVYKDLYRERRAAMLDSLESLMPPGTHWTKPAGGFYVWLTLPDGLDGKAMLPRAVNSRVAYVPGNAFFADGSGRSSMRLSYCFPPPERIREGVRRLAGVIEEEMDLVTTFGRGTAAPYRHGRQAPTANAPGPEVQ